MAVSAVTLLSACKMKPPVLPYIAVGMYSGECGYDWNGAAFSVDQPESRRPWKGSKEVAMLIRFPPVDKACAIKAYRLLVKDGFKRIYVTSTTHPRVGSADPALMP